MNARDLLAAATSVPRPWRAALDDILDAEDSFVVETFGPDEPETLLIIAAVNEYEALLGIAETAAKFRRVAVTGEGHSRMPGHDLDTALARLDAVRSGT